MPVVYSAAEWKEWFQAYVRTGIPIVEFHRKKLPDLLKGRPVPTLNTVYERFRALNADSSPVKITQLGSNCRLAQVPESGNAPAAEPSGNADSVLFRMQLPNGTFVEFPTKSPESLAFRLAAFFGGVN